MLLWIVPAIVTVCGLGVSRALMRRICAGSRRLTDIARG
jgi:hypothetical protein